MSPGEVQPSRDREELQRLPKSKQGHKDGVSCFQLKASGFFHCSGRRAALPLAAFAGRRG